VAVCSLHDRIPSKPEFFSVPKLSLKVILLKPSNPEIMILPDQRKSWKSASYRFLILQIFIDFDRGQLSH